MSESSAPQEKAINRLWDTHLQSEFAHKSPEEAMATMTGNPRVTIMPTMIGGRGAEELLHFYEKHFLNQLPPDIEVVPLSRTIGQGRAVDEMVIRFTHTIQMDWVLPGVAPTGKRIEFAMVVVVQTEGDKISSENLYWDNATILRQAGLITDSKLPILGAESARNMLQHTAPLNELIRRTQR
jgi:carboxymethylenebutenolidase